MMVNLYSRKGVVMAVLAMSEGIWWYTCTRSILVKTVVPYRADDKVLDVRY